LNLGEANLFAQVESDTLVDAEVVQAHAGANDLRTPLELHLKGLPQDAPSPDEHTEGTPKQDTGHNLKNVQAR
jgi:hypothetical protein